MSLRWRLILVAGSVAIGTALVLTVVLHFRSRHQLLQQLEKTLEWKCDEVITILSEDAPLSMLEGFLFIETNYRSSPHTYFYQIWDAPGRILARSENLGRFQLPAPEFREQAAVRFQIEPHPLSSEGEWILLRSERVGIGRVGGEPTAFVIQTAASLVPLEAAVSRTLRDALLVAAAGVAVAFSLLWFVTTHALRPVSVLTEKASEITATNVRDRLPLTGRGDELDKLAEVLNEMLDRLDTSMRQIGQFSSDAAHELRTPLTRIRGELDLILRNDGSTPPRRQLEAIQEEIERLGQLCGRLLLLARIDRAPADAGLLDDRVDLEEVVSELLDQLVPVAVESGVRLQGVASVAVPIQGSRALIVEALLNLLDNAIRSTPRGGRVSVSIDANRDVARISVEDTGPGIPPEERERIFRRFYRIPRASTGTTDEGIGLGLAIVKGIAQAHGGGVEVVDAPDGGSVFRLILPIRRA